MNMHNFEQSERVVAVDDFNLKAGFEENCPGAMLIGKQFNG